MDCASGNAHTDANENKAAIANQAKSLGFSQNKYKYLGKRTLGTGMEAPGNFARRKPKSGHDTLSGVPDSMPTAGRADVCSTGAATAP